MSRCVAVGGVGTLERCSRERVTRWCVWARLRERAAELAVGASKLTRIDGTTLPRSERMLNRR